MESSTTYHHHQQQTGESTSSQSSPDRNNGNTEEKRETDRIIRTMVNFMTLLADMPDSPLGNAGRYAGVSHREEDPPYGVSERKPSRRRRRTMTPMVSSPTWNIGSSPASTTPEREIPSSSEETSEDMLLLPGLSSKAIHPDSSAPPLIPLSPDDLGCDDTYHQQYQQQAANDNTTEFMTQEERYCRSRSWAKQKLASVIFSHPGSLRSFCVEAHQQTIAKQQSSKNNPQTEEDSATEEVYEFSSFDIRNGVHSDRIIRHCGIPRGIISIPLSITFDTLNVTREITLDVSFATVRITLMALDASVCVVVYVWDGVTRFNPLNFAYKMITKPFNMMGKTTEVVVSGIQSVATGVGSASSIALHRLSAKTRSPLSSGLVGSQGNLRRVLSPTKKSVNQKLLKKLNTLNSAAPVLSYTELDDNDGGLSRHAKSRVQRMMHYDVSLRPFVATVQLQDAFKKDDVSRNAGFYNDDDDGTSVSSSPLEGPFMCTPQSFPPTPASRAHVLKRGSRFADDVVFLARDQLRVHDGLESSNERTREMAEALTQGKRLAVFDADDASAGIDLSCGQHGKLPP